MTEPHIFRMLDASTAHLPTRMRRDLKEQPGVIADKREYGWLLWVPEDIDERIFEFNEDGPVPAAVIAIWRKAAELNCQYVLLDTDGPKLDGLPTY